MADNITLNAGSGGSVIATDDDGSKHHQLVKIEFGADGTQTPVDASNPLPIEPGTSVTFTVTNAGTFAVQAAQSGTWNIGDVTGTVSLPTGAATAANQSTANTALAAIQTAVEVIDNAIGGNEMQVDIVTAAARDRTADNVGAALQTDALMNDTTALTPKFAKISCAASGDNTLVAGVGGKKLRLLSFTLIATGAVSIYLKSATAGAIFADATNAVPLDKTGAAGAAGFVLGFNPLGWCETTTGEALQVNLSGAVGVCGVLTYVEV